MYYACMPNIQVRDVPPDVHARLVARAARRGQSLQQYLAGELAGLATAPTLDDVIDQIEARANGVRLTVADVIDSLDVERAERDRR